MEELLDFLWEQGAEDELPEEFALVQERAERVAAARAAERDKRLRQDQEHWNSAGRSDTARDRALVTELMRRLDDER